MNKLGIGFSPEGRFKKQLTDRIHNGLKCYEIVDGEITGMALTRTPAHSINAAIVSEEDRTIGGPVLIPDRMIYKINPITGEEHYIFFTPAVIERIGTRYQKAISWTNEELWTLVLRYVEGNTSKEIALLLNREEEEVLDKIRASGDHFKDLVFIIMIQKNKTDQEIEDLLGISPSEIPSRIVKLGGKVTKISDSKPKP